MAADEQKSTPHHAAASAPGDRYSALLEGLLDLTPAARAVLGVRKPIRETASYDFASYETILPPQYIYFTSPDPGLGGEEPVDLDKWVDFDWFLRLFSMDFQLVVENEYIVSSRDVELDGGSGGLFIRDETTLWEVRAYLTRMMANAAQPFRASMGLALFELYLTARDPFAFVDRARQVVRNWFASQLRAMTGTDNTVSASSLATILSVRFWAQGIGPVIAQIGPFEREPAPEPEARRPLFGEKLPSHYSFTPYEPGTVNFGLQVVYRQSWVPLGTQTGEVVRTLPLGPRQSEKISIKIVRNEKSSRLSETAQSLETSNEMSSTAKDSHEIINELSLKFNWDVSASVGGPLGSLGAGANGGSGNNGTAAGGSSLGASAGGEMANSSRDTKSFLNEVTSKVASKLRSDTKIVINTAIENSEERNHASEITNPNDEIAVTYIYSRLQRQYEVQSFMQAVNAVVFVAEPIPAPKDITEDWIRRHDWILAKVLRDESFRSDLDLIRNWEVAGYNPEPIDPRIARLMGTLSGDVPGDPAGIPLAYANVQGRIPDLFQTMQQAYEREVERERARRAQRETLLRAVRRLRGHIYDNILHYCRAIWSSEDPEARMLRFRQIRLPVRWDFIVTGPPGHATIDGEFAPAVEDLLADTRPLSNLVDMSGPVGYHGNYSVYRLKLSEQWASLLEMIKLSRSAFQKIRVNVRMLDQSLAANWHVFGVASPSRLESRKYRLTHSLAPQPSFEVSVERAAGVFEPLETIALVAGKPIQFQGIRVWIEPAVANAVLNDGAVFEVVVRQLPVLEDPELRALKWTSGPLRPEDEVDIFTPETIVAMAELFADCAAAIEGIAPEVLSWEALSQDSRDLLRQRYYDYLLRNLHTRRILVDTNNVVLTREVDTSSSLEPFKALHRHTDVLAAYEDMLTKRLENQRYAVRLDEGRLGDPNIDRMTVVAGNAHVSDLIALDVDDDPPGPTPSSSR